MDIILGIHQKIIYKFNNNQLNDRVAMEIKTSSICWLSGKVTIKTNKKSTQKYKINI